MQNRGRHQRGYGAGQDRQPIEGEKHFRAAEHAVEAEPAKRQGDDQDLAQIGKAEPDAVDQDVAGGPIRRERRDERHRKHLGPGARRTAQQAGEQDRVADPQGRYAAGVLYERDAGPGRHEDAKPEQRQRLRRVALPERGRKGLGRRVHEMETPAKLGQGYPARG